MTAKEIKEKVDNGETVFWANRGYQVIKDSIGQYLVWCTMNDNYTGLTSVDGVLNGKPEDFFAD